MEETPVPFNRASITGKERDYIAEALSSGALAGDGPFTKRCQAWLEKRTGCARALLTHSCTAALEMAALLLDIEPGDEIIMPSYTFVSTANAFVLRGAIPVFVDVREDTLNLDERLIQSAITPRTRAIVPVHYAGVACEMDVIMATAIQHGLKVVEDSAQGLMASYKGQELGSIGDLGAYSFHESKNVISGEGGALLVNSRELALRAEIIREKGTDRSRFIRGEVDKYTWQEAGSSFLPGELIAAFLAAQLEHADDITRNRLAIWDLYHELLAPMEEQGLLRRPVVPDTCRHNGHMYYVLLPPDVSRQLVIGHLKQSGVNAVFHYVPLHSSPAGKRYGRISGDLDITSSIAGRLIRLPLWARMDSSTQSRVAQALERAVIAALKV